MRRPWSIAPAQRSAVLRAPAKPGLAALIALVGCAGEGTPQPTCTDGKLLDDGVCVDPWRYGSPSFSRCDGGRSTPETLAQKAALYDARVFGLYVHPEMPWVLDVALAGGRDPETATWHDVAAWRSGENDGLW